MTDGPSRYVLAVSLEPLDATTTLFFGHLGDGVDGALRVVRYDHPDLAGQLSGASAVVLVRALFEMEKVEWTCRVLGIPLYYFVDDNFMVLREQPGAWSQFVGRYSVANVRDRLRGFAGVMLSSPTLIKYFEHERLHPRPILFPPLGWPQRIPASATRSPIPGVAFFGGLHLHATFLESVLPAVRRLAVERPVRLIAAGVPEPIMASPGLTITPHAYDLSYANGLRSLAESGVDVLLHPSVAGLTNNAFKNPHALISADAIGAIPVVSARPPYDQLRDAGVSLQCDDTVDSWYAALKSALQPEVRRDTAERLASFCASYFNGTDNRRLIEGMLQAHPAPPAGRKWWRPTLVRALLLVGKAQRVLKLAGR